MLEPDSDVCSRLCVLMVISDTEVICMFSNWCALFFLFWQAAGTGEWLFSGWSERLFIRIHRSLLWWPNPRFEALLHIFPWELRIIVSFPLVPSPSLNKSSGLVLSARLASGRQEFFLAGMDAYFMAARPRRIYCDRVINGVRQDMPAANLWVSLWNLNRLSEG